MSKFNAHLCVLNCFLRRSMLGRIFLDVKSITLLSFESLNSFANYVSLSNQIYAHAYDLACFANLGILSQFNSFLLSIFFTDCTNFSFVDLCSIGNRLYEFFENPQE